MIWCDDKLAPVGEFMPKGAPYWERSYGGGGRAVPSPAVGLLVLLRIKEPVPGENIERGGNSELPHG